MGIRRGQIPHASHLQYFAQLITLLKLHQATISKVRQSLLTNRIAVLVCVYPSMHHTIKQVIHDFCKTLSIQHPMQSTNKDGLYWLKAPRVVPHKVRVCHHPRNHLHLQYSQEIYCRISFVVIFNILHHH